MDERETSGDVPSGSDAPTIQTFVGQLRPGDRVGHYKILETLGEGGFAVVYLAEQTEPVRRRVALKIIKPGMDTREVIARFEAERQALAMMDHACVAKVFDAGSTKSGRPYFVMEHVPGVSVSSTVWVIVPPFWLKYISSTAPAPVMINRKRRLPQPGFPRSLKIRSGSRSTASSFRVNGDRKIDPSP